MSEGIDRTSPAKKKRVRIHETTLENDIRYRGPLSSRHFKILGWLCLVLGQILMIVRLGGRLDAGFAADTASWLKALSNVADLSLPFLLIASFAQLLNTDVGYKRQLIVNGAAMAGICALYYLLFYRYTVGNVASLLETPSDALPIVKSGLATFAPYGFLTFNIFVDLFLCALTMVFLNYNPRRVFTGKWRICFRLLALLPIAYEVGCMVLKVYSARGQVEIPTWAFPLLTVKPPMTFVLFVALALFVKTRELRFRRNGKTHEEYRAFLKTNRNSWNFSVFLAIMLVIVSLLDFVAVMGFSLNEVVQTMAPIVSVNSTEAAPEDPAATVGRTAVTPLPARRTLSPVTTPEAPATPGEGDEALRQAQDSAAKEALVQESIDTGMRIALAVGFGGSVGLIFMAPLVLLFSYTRRPKSPMLDLLIPVAGIALILLVYLEGTHQLLGTLPIPKINLQEFKDSATIYMNQFMQ